MLRRLVLAALSLGVLAAASPARVERLELRYDRDAAHSAPATTTSRDSDGSERYASIIAAHAVCGFLAFQIFMPLGVAFAAVGKSWFPEQWFRAHWKAQAFLTFPFAILALVLAAVAVAVEPTSADVLGFILISTIFLQGVFGAWSHKAHINHERFAAEHGLPEPLPQRRLQNWLHLGLGVALLTFGGLQVTWGFGEYQIHVGYAVPRWIEVIHYIVAGIAVLIATPFILVRGRMRMRAGASFGEAFFALPSRKRKYTSVPPPRQLYLGSSSYVEDSYGPGGIVFDEEVEKNGGKEDDLARVASAASSWPGHMTREEYEADIEAHRVNVGGTEAAPSVYSFSAFDYERQAGNEETSALLSAAQPAPTSLPLPGEADIDSLHRTPSKVPLPPSAAPSPVPSFSPALDLPPMTPVFSSPPPVGFTFVSSAAPSPASQPANSTLSPRLSFMPFPGPDAVPPLSPGTSLTPASTLPRAGDNGKSTDVELHSPPAGEGEATAPATLVPSPPPPPTSTPALERVTSVATTQATACGGESGSVPAPAAVSPTVARHSSLAAAVERTEGEEAQEVAGRVTQREGEGMARPAKDQEAEHDPDRPLFSPSVIDGDDAESTRLFDELERELTISTMRSGRSRVTAVGEEKEEEEAEPAAGGEEGESAVGEDAKSVASGVWMAGGKK
ncbi:hypothetical protein JCM8097_006562 [Rhodosporidiobolus ruineniae]